MPLIHSKKPSAFKENIRTEVHHGKPVKQAVAIAYSIKRKAQHNHAEGGKVKGCPACESHMPMHNTAANEKEPRKLHSGGGYAEGGPVLPGAQSFQDSFRKSTGQNKAKGGMIKGVHEQTSHGASHAGALAEYAHEMKNSENEEYQKRSDKILDEAKGLHQEKLHELKTMPNPKLKGLAEGGEVHEIEEDPDRELDWAIGEEFMQALESKDHKRLMEPLKALILSCMNKKED